MRKWTTGVVLVGVLTASSVFAQSLRQPTSYRQVTYQEDPYYYMAAKEPAKAATNEKSSAVADACNACCADRRSTCLPHRCCCCCNELTMGGWLQAGMTGNGQDPYDRYNGPVMTNDRVGDLQMNQAWFYAERTARTGGAGGALGGRVDAFYGTDWRVADYFGYGLEDRINGPNDLYGLSIPQFYLEIGVDNLSIKMGRMAGVLGYESLLATNNFFYSHDYQFSYVEPILITGLMTEYQFADQLKFYAGFHNGYHNFENRNGDLNGQGGVVWTSCDGGTSLAYALDVGRNDIHALEDQYVHSIVFKKRLTHRLEYVFKSDLSYLNGVGGQADTEAYGIAQYLFYKIDRKWTAGMRIEWFRDDDGTKVLGIGNLPDARGWDGAAGYAGNFTELTMGLNWKPRRNIAVRPEIRWDWYDGPANPNGPDAYPFDDGNKKTQFTFATDVIITF